MECGFLNTDSLPLGECVVDCVYGLGYYSLNEQMNALPKSPTLLNKYRDTGYFPRVLSLISSKVTHLSVLMSIAPGVGHTDPSEAMWHLRHTQSLAPVPAVMWEWLETAVLVFRRDIKTGRHPAGDIHTNNRDGCLQVHRTLSEKKWRSVPLTKQARVTYLDSQSLYQELGCAFE